MKNSGTFGLFVLDKSGRNLAEEYLDSYEPQTKLGRKRYWSFSSEAEVSSLWEKIIALDEKLAEPEPEVTLAPLVSTMESQPNRFRVPGFVLKDLECGSEVKVFSTMAFSLDGPVVKKILSSGIFEGRYCRTEWLTKEVLIFSFTLYEKVLQYLMTVG